MRHFAGVSFFMSKNKWGDLRMKKLKRVVIKEELVVLTGDFKKAILLNQFIYWSERVRDFDKFIEEEKERYSKEGKEINLNKERGWMYKKAEELSEETMLNLSDKTIRSYIKDFVKNGWIDERENPEHKWDRTKQYRVNIVKIQSELFELGYSLEGYPLNIENLELGKKKNGDGNKKKEENKELETKETPQTLETPSRKKGKMEEEKMKTQRGKKERAIPEITTEITTDVYNQSVSQSIDTGDIKSNQEIKIYGQTDISTQLLEKHNKTIRNCEIYAIDKKYQNAVVHAIKLLFLDIENKKKVNIGDNIIPAEILERDLEKLNFFVLEHAVNKFKAASREKEIRNKIGYLKTCIYNSIHEIDVDVDSELMYQGFI